MLNLGVDSNTAGMFIARTCSLALLTDEHSATLHSLVDNISRVLDLTTEKLGEDEAEKRRQLCILCVMCLLHLGVPCCLSFV